MPEITIEGPDGAFMAYLARPDLTPAAAIVVSQEIFGVNAVMRDVCDWLSSEGFLACCPDLFWRIEPGIQLTDKSDAEWKRAFELFGLFDAEAGLRDLQATINALRALEGCNGKVGSVGYCLGGKMAYLTAARTDVDASVSYYGVGLNELLEEAATITKPTLLHIASEDQFVPPAAQAAIKAGLAGHAQVALEVYEGQDHAFARIGGEHYDAAAAQLANDRTIALFEEHLT